MGGEGSILGMIISYRENMQKRRKKSMFARDRKFDSEDIAIYNHLKYKLDVKKLSEEELKIYRDKIAGYNKKIKRRQIAILLAIIIPISAGIYGLAQLVIVKGPNTVEIKDQTAIQKKREDFVFYINDGDQWAEQQKWKNAIYQYENAIKLFPNDYMGNYRLARAYVNDCRSNNKSCDKALDLLNLLISKYPKKVSLHELRAEYYISLGLIEYADADYEIIEKINESR